MKNIYISPKILVLESLLEDECMLTASQKETTTESGASDFTPGIQNPIVDPTKSVTEDDI